MSAGVSVLPRIPLRAALLIATLCVLAAGAAKLLTPRLTAVQNAPDIDSTLPRKFGDWRELPSPISQVSLATGEGPNIDRPYDQTVMRSYVNGKGDTVMLAVAWGAQQRQEVKVHRPDLCYVAQGHKVLSLLPHDFGRLSGASDVVGKHMVTTSPRAGEVVSYWIRIGTLYSEDALATRLHIFREGLGGHIPDGVLVRASQVIHNSDEAAAAWPVIDGFLSELIDAVPPETRALLVR